MAPIHSAIDLQPPSKHTGSNRPHVYRYYGADLLKCELKYAGDDSPVLPPAGTLPIY